MGYWLLLYMRDHLKTLLMLMGDVKLKALPMIRMTLMLSEALKMRVDSPSPDWTFLPLLVLAVE